MPKLKITNMVMVQDKNTRKVVVQERVKAGAASPFLQVTLRTARAFTAVSLGKSRKKPGWISEISNPAGLCIGSTTKPEQ